MIILVTLSAFPPLADAQTTSPKRIYIANGDHTDYLWTAGEADYRDAFLEMLDYYLDLADLTRNDPSPYKSRFSCDGSFWVWTYEKNRTAAQMNRLISRIRDGHLSVPYNALISCYGGQPAEAILRGMYYAGGLERRHGLDLTLAKTVENQTLPYGLGALWAGAGALYSWAGIYGGDTKIMNVGRREREIYWWTGPDGSRILMKWNSLLQNDCYSIGGYAEVFYPEELIDYVDQSSQFRAVYPYRVIGAFQHGGDQVATITDLLVETAWEETTADRQIIVSNEQDFFDDFRATYGATLPTEGRSYGNEWDLYCASMAEVTARVRRAVEKLRSAEAMATLVSLRQPGFMNGRQAARDRAWMDLGLYWEHDWTANGEVSISTRAAWQRRLASEIESYVNTLHADAATALGALIPRGNTGYLRFYVFNPLSWTRTDRADLPYTGTGAVHVLDLSTGRETPAQRVTLEGRSYLRVLAYGVPPVGYKAFEIVPGPGAGFSNAATVNGNVIENSVHRLSVSTAGAITSLIDKSRGNRQFARLAGGRTINDLGSSGGTLSVENPGPVSVTLKAVGSEPLQHTSRITLTRDSGQIEIRNTIDENFSDIYTWGFGFALNQPDTRHEEVGAIVRARLTTGGGHYSPRNMRYDWLTLNHFADMSDPAADVGVTLSSADCCFMRLGLSTVTTLDTATPLLSPLVGGQLDGLDLGIPDQGGDRSFLQRFALQTHGAYNAAAAMRFAFEHQNPLVAATVSGSPGNYPERSYSLLSISNSNVLLWALKPPEDGAGEGRSFVARVWNLSSGPVACSLATPPMRVASAMRLTHVETPMSAAPVAGGKLNMSLAGQQLQTFAITVDPRANAAPDAWALYP